MKKSIKVFLFLPAFIASAVYSQTEEITKEDKKIKLGFSLGVNHNNLLVKSQTSYQTSATNKIGFQLGLLAEKRISKLVFISPRVDMDFNRLKLSHREENSVGFEQDVLPVRINVMAYFVCRDSDKSMQPYFYFGPALKTPVTSKNHTEVLYKFTPDLALDFGLGLNKVFPELQIAPEIKYSIGLKNLSNVSSIKSLNVHTLSLVLNFKSK